MRVAWGQIGVSGAIVVLVGLVLVGSSLVITAAATQSEFNCNLGGGGSSCTQTLRTAQNDSILAEFILAGGVITTGVGFFVVALSVVSVMAQRALPPAVNDVRR